MNQDPKNLILAIGFLLLYCPPKAQHRVREALRELKELPFSLERDGTKVILNARR